MGRRLTLLRLLCVRIFVIVFRRLPSGKGIEALNLRSSAPLTTTSTNASKRLHRRLRDALMAPRIKGIRRNVNVRGARRASPLRVRSLNRRLHASRGINLSFLGQVRGTFMNQPYANDIRVRAHRHDLRRGVLCSIFCLLHARATLCRFHVPADQAAYQGNMNMATVVTHRLIRSSVMDRASVAVLTFKRPSTDITFRRQYVAPAILRRCRLFLLLRHAIRLFWWA